MTILRKCARPLLASSFIAGGYSALRNSEALAPAAEPVVRRITEQVPSLAKNPEQFVRINAGVQLGAGVLLSLGRFPRLASLALAATLVPTTLAEHAYWTVEDPEERSRQKIFFFKNVSLLGGLAIAAADTHGKPSLAYRSQKAAGRGRRSARAAAARSTDNLQSAAHSVRQHLPLG
ncbi:DoxX family protein [Streptomyces sp. NPDC006733]|uniref:DoxX family protein n=1 Tax=Streptomyces sp. NPDC006733 TaxID=3155460 RepID=UPI0033CE247F